MPTHGVCSRHPEQILESLPLTSFPDVEVLIVVRLKEAALYEYLQRSFAGVRRVKVIVERRVGDRRREPHVPAEDRRCETRRIRHGKVSTLGYAIVGFRRT